MPIPAPIYDDPEDDLSHLPPEIQEKVRQARAGLPTKSSEPYQDGNFTYPEPDLPARPGPDPRAVAARRFLHGRVADTMLSDEDAIRLAESLPGFKEAGAEAPPRPGVEEAIKRIADKMKAEGRTEPTWLERLSLAAMIPSHFVEGAIGATEHGATAAGRALKGEMGSGFDPATGHLTDEAITSGLDWAGVAATSGFASAAKAPKPVGLAARRNVPNLPQEISHEVGPNPAVRAQLADEAETSAGVNGTAPMDELTSMVNEGRDLDMGKPSSPPVAPYAEQPLSMPPSPAMELGANKGRSASIVGLAAEMKKYRQVIYEGDEIMDLVLEEYSRQYPPGSVAKKRATKGMEDPEEHYFEWAESNQNPYVDRLLKNHAEFEKYEAKYGPYPFDGPELGANRGKSAGAAGASAELITYRRLQREHDQLIDDAGQFYLGLKGLSHFDEKAFADFSEWLQTPDTPYNKRFEENAAVYEPLFEKYGELPKDQQDIDLNANKGKGAAAAGLTEQALADAKGFLKEKGVSTRGMSQRKVFDTAYDNKWDPELAGFGQQKSSLEVSPISEKNASAWTDEPFEKAEDWALDQVKEFIKSGAEPEIIDVKPGQAKATQYWVDPVERGGGYPVWDELADYPVVARTPDGELHVLDGHHRMDDANRAGKTLKAYVIDVDPNLNIEVQRKRIDRMFENGDINEVEYENMLAKIEGGEPPIAGAIKDRVAGEETPDQQNLINEDFERTEFIGDRAAELWDELHPDGDFPERGTPGYAEFERLQEQAGKEYDDQLGKPTTSLPPRPVPTERDVADYNDWFDEFDALGPAADKKYAELFPERNPDKIQADEVLRDKWWGSPENPYQARIQELGDKMKAYIAKFGRPPPRYRRGNSGGFDLNANRGKSSAALGLLTSPIDRWVNDPRTMGKATGAEWAKAIDRIPGRKVDEIKFREIDKFLEKNADQKITKAELQEYLIKSDPQITEVIRGQVWDPRDEGLTADQARDYLKNVRKRDDIEGLGDEMVFDAATQAGWQRYINEQKTTKPILDEYNAWQEAHNIRGSMDEILRSMNYDELDDFTRQWGRLPLNDEELTQLQSLSDRWSTAKQQAHDEGRSPGTKYGETYVTKGGPRQKNYREYQWFAPAKIPDEIIDTAKDPNSGSWKVGVKGRNKNRPLAQFTHPLTREGKPNVKDWTEGEAMSIGRELVKQKLEAGDDGFAYTHGHWPDDRSFFAHARTNEWTLPTNGRNIPPEKIDAKNRVLFIEGRMSEIESLLRNREYKWRQEQENEIYKKQNAGELTYAQADEARHVLRGTKSPASTQADAYLKELKDELVIQRANAKIEEAEGVRAFNIEEGQSDQYQQGRKIGFMGEPPNLDEWHAYKFGKGNNQRWRVMDPDGSMVADVPLTQVDNAKAAIDYVAATSSHSSLQGVLPGPLQKQWQEFILKRLVQEAVMKGYGAVSWTTGRTQAQRYRRPIKNLDYNMETHQLDWYSGERSEGYNKQTKFHSPKTLSSAIGKEAADKVLNQPEPIGPPRPKYTVKKSQYNDEWTILDDRGEWVNDVYSKEDLDKWLEKNQQELPIDQIRKLNDVDLLYAEGGMSGSYDVIWPMTVKKLFGVTPQKLAVGTRSTSLDYLTNAERRVYDAKVKTIRDEYAKVQKAAENVRNLAQMQDGVQRGDDAWIAAQKAYDAADYPAWSKMQKELDAALPKEDIIVNYFLITDELKKKLANGQNLWATGVPPVPQDQEDRYAEGGVVASHDPKQRQTPETIPDYLAAALRWMGQFERKEQVKPNPKNILGIRG